MLVVFKYFSFLYSSVTQPGNILSFKAYQANDWILPAGISFYTFQSLSYTIDVYRKKLTPEKSIVDYALYVSFFPQLVAGPIERYGHLMPQLKSVKKIKFQWENFYPGLRLIIWGFFKKLVIADRIAPMVNAAYGDVSSYHGLEWLLIGFLFLVQIYADFSGYTDIARGTARLFGINLMMNWLRPFYSDSIKNFWKNWHISLSTWFKDYVYHPLGGNKKGKTRMLLNILIVFLVSGFWHGANFTFLIWGLLNAIWVIVEIVMAPVFKKIRFPSIIKWVYVILIQSIFFIAFRANSLQDLMVISGELFYFSHFYIKIKK
jgi:D-alanyl-lipoteichoic acid acyltransferase DltB (MBOAT superfamily)